MTTSFFELKAVRNTGRPVDCNAGLFDSIDELVSASPYLSSYRSAQTHTGSDVKNKKATIYEIESFKPSEDKTSSLPLDTSSIKPDSQKKHWTWEYSIYEYSDGSCRFVILVKPF